MARAKAGELSARADVKADGDYKLLVDGVNEMLDALIGPLNVAAEYVDRISKGDIPPKITDTYNGDFNEIKNNLNKCIDAVNALVAEPHVLAKAAVEGKLATRADASKHRATSAKIVEGVNDTLDAVIGPLNVAAEYVDRISKGDIPEQITDTYNGDFNEIKNNLNKCIDAVNALVADAAASWPRRRSRASWRPGPMPASTRATSAKIVEGVNATLDCRHRPAERGGGVCGPDQQGGHPPEDHRHLQRRLQRDQEQPEQVHRRRQRHGRRRRLSWPRRRWRASWLPGRTPPSTRATSGRSSRASTTPWTAVIGPLNVAAEYVDRISKGDIPPADHRHLQRRLQRDQEQPEQVHRRRQRHGRRRRSPGQGGGGGQAGDPGGRLQAPGRLPQDRRGRQRHPGRRHRPPERGGGVRGPDQQGGHPPDRSPTPTTATSTRSRTT